MITIIDLSKDMSYQILFLVFNIFAIIVTSVIPVFVAVFISKVILAKEINFRAFFPFIVSVIFFTAIACVVWEVFVNNHIYYEWDKLYIPEFNLIFHEVPSVGNNGIGLGGSWIAEGWTVTGLNLFAFLMRLVIYLWAFAIATMQNMKKKEALPGDFIKTLLLSIGILLLLSLIIPPGFQSLYRYLNPPIPVMGI